MRPEIGGVLPVFVLDRYEGLEARLVQDLTPEERDRYVELNASALRERLPADVVFANHVVLGGPVAAATGAPFRVKAHGSELEYSMRGNEELSAWGREALARADAVFVGSAHIRQVLEDVVGHVGRVVEVPPGVDVDAFRPVPRDEALARLLDEARRDPPNPGQRERAPAGRGQRRALRRVLRAAGADRRLLREAHLQQGRPPAARGARRPRREGGDRRLRRLPRGAGGARVGADALHRRARAPAPGGAAAAVRRRGRAVDLPRGVRHGRGRGRGGGSAAARRAPLRSRRGRRRARGRVSARARAAHELLERRRRRAARQARRAARAAGGRARGARRRGSACGASRAGAGRAWRNASWRQ